MKIIVNALPLLNITTGIGRYLKELYTNIKIEYPEIEISYFNGHSICTEMPISPSNKSLWTAMVNMVWKMPAFLPYFARVVFHKKSAKRFSNLSKGFDIYHEAGYIPFKSAENVKTIFTIHDLSLNRLPEFHPKDRCRFFDRYFKQSLKFVDSFVTPSEFTKKEIQSLYPEIDKSITSIPLGFDKILFQKQKKEHISLFKKNWDLPEEYILFVGTLDPRKNIVNLFRALKELPKHITIVCTGWSGWQNISGSEFNFKNSKSRILFTGYVTDQELALLYSGARVFVYPSFYEGFGLPILEAMACGCPVVCSGRASLPEVVGDAAIICSPTDCNSIAKAIYDIFNSDELYQEMSLKGILQSRKFSWGKTAKQTVNLFLKEL